MPLSPDDDILLNAAEGFIKLKSYLDADAALDDIDPFCRHLPEVLAVRVRVYQALERWELMEGVAKRMVEYIPDDAGWWILWAQATSHANSVEAARLILVNALEHHEEDAGVHFNLACYECGLENMERTKECLKRCFDLDPSWRILALEDEDLKPLGDSL
jgi:tetratricopeptide (TPR) repeat protein